MRRLKTLMVLVGFGLCISGVPQALAGTINVKVNGTAVPCPATSSPCDTSFDLSTATLPAGTKFTISNGPLGAAKIVADDVSPLDTLRLENTIFTATAAFAAYTIHFWRTFDIPPTTDGGNIVNFKRQASLAFIRTPTTAPVTATVSITGKTTGIIIEGQVNKQVYCNLLSCGQFTIPAISPLQFYDAIGHKLNTPHEVRGEITNFKLPATGDKLQLDEFKIWSEAGAGGDLRHTGVTYKECTKCD